MSELCLKVSRSKINAQAEDPQGACQASEGDRRWQGEASAGWNEPSDEWQERQAAPSTEKTGYRAFGECRDHEGET